MKNICRHRYFALVIVLLAVMAGLSACTGHRHPWFNRDPIPVTILFFNDIHGHLRPYHMKIGDEKVEVGGVARLAALVRNIRVENEKIGKKTFVFIAGDILQGTPLSTVYQGKPDVEIFNAMGVDAMAIGNHEFGFGMENFLTLKQQAAFPFLSANVRIKNTGELLCDSDAVFPLSSDLTLTVIGVTTRELLTTTRPDYVAGLAMDDSVASVRETLKNRKSRGPVILLSHSRHEVDKQIAAAFPELGAIISGHDHLLFSPYLQANGVPIFEALENGRYLGRIDLAVDPVTGASVLESSDYLPVTAAIGEDEAIAGIVADYNRRLGSQLQEVIGQSTMGLDGTREHVRHEETALGNFVADVMRQYTGAEIALVNSGALRAGIEPGPITLKSVYKVLPYNNQIIRVDLSGREILKALKRSVRGTWEDEDGGFLQVSGIRFTIQRHDVVDVRIGPDNRPLDEKQVYSVAVPELPCAWWRRLLWDL